MKLRLARPGTLVDIGRLGLTGVTDGGDHLAIGALTATTTSDTTRSPRSTAR